MADASDSKSDVGDYMWVQVPPPAPYKSHRNSVVFLFSTRSLMDKTMPSDGIVSGSTPDE